MPVARTAASNVVSTGDPGERDLRGLVGERQRDGRDTA